MNPASGAVRRTLLVRRVGRVRSRGRSGFAGRTCEARRSTGTGWRLGSCLPAMRFAFEASDRRAPGTMNCPPLTLETRIDTDGRDGSGVPRTARKADTRRPRSNARVPRRAHTHKRFINAALSLTFSVSARRPELNPDAHESRTYTARNLSRNAGLAGVPRTSQLAGEPPGLGGENITHGRTLTITFSGRHDCYSPATATRSTPGHRPDRSRAGAPRLAQTDSDGPTGSPLAGGQRAADQQPCALTTRPVAVNLSRTRTRYYPTSGARGTGRPAPHIHHMERPLR